MTPIQRYFDAFDPSYRYDYNTNMQQLGRAFERVDQPVAKKEKETCSHNKTYATNIRKGIYKCMNREKRLKK